MSARGRGSVCVCHVRLPLLASRLASHECGRAGAYICNEASMPALPQGEQQVAAAQAQRNQQLPPLHCHKPSSPSRRYLRCFPLTLSLSPQQTMTFSKGSSVRTIYRYIHNTHKDKHKEGREREGGDEFVGCELKTCKGNSKACRSNGAATRPLERERERVGGHEQRRSRQGLCSRQHSPRCMYVN